MGQRNSREFLAGDEGVVVGAWTLLTLQNSWVTLGGRFFDPAYRLVHFGSATLVFIRGQAQSGTITNGTVVATLPVGARPSKDRNFPSERSGSGDPFAWEVLTDGTMVIYSLGSNSQLAFDQIPPFWAD